MIYVSGFEIYNTNSGVRKEILLSEGVPHLVHFDPDLKMMRYVYPHADPRKNLTVSLNMIIPGKFKINYFFREQEYNMEVDVSQSTILYIPNYVIQTGCQEEDELCSVTVQLENTEIFDYVDPQVEIMIKQIKNTPYYVPRGIIRKDYISGEAYLFLYTNVGQDEGYITVNFDRESGFVYGKVVEIYQETQDDKADWRNYRFIRNKNEKDSLYYDFYNKKLLFTKSDTNKCREGCYILISIKTSVYKTDILDSEYQYFSLLADFSPKNYADKHLFPKKIRLDPEEYIIGSLFKEEGTNGENLCDYYTFKIPYNIQGLEVDWQSETAGLMILFGQGRPSNSTKPHFNFTKRRDTNIQISRLEILRKYNDDDNMIDDGRSLLGMDIVFGVYTKYYDSINFTPYAFRVHLPKPELNIYKITSDQKTICKPEKLSDNQYRCLFMVTYQRFQLFNDLIVYAKSQSPSAVVNMYSNFIEVDIYDSYNVEELKKRIPTEENAVYNTKRDLTKFIFLSYGDFDSNAYISVISDKADDIELYTSFKTFEDQLSPNPSSAQVYSMDLLKKNISIDFITTKSFSVNIMSLYGEARISLEKDPHSIFYLRGAEDSLDYIIKGKEGNNTLLYIENLRYGSTTYKNPGFAFVLEFHLRSIGIELDLMNIDDTSEIVYKQADFPIYYYAKIFDPDNDINAFLYLHNIIYDSSDMEKRTIVPNELVIKAAVMEESTVLRIKEDPTKISSYTNDLTIEGIYDSSLQAGNIIIPKENIKTKTAPTLFMVIQKGKSEIDIKYNRIRGEIGFSTINGDSPITQKLYQFSKIKDKDTIISHKLTTDRNSKYMRIQFSANSDFVDFSINTIKKTKDNGGIKDKTEIVERGIKYVTFERPDNCEFLYLNVFLKGISSETKLNNYVFKYINAAEKSGFFEFKILGNNDTIELEKEGETDSNLKVRFYPIDFTYDPTSGVDTSIIYTVKLVKKDGLVQDENANTIAITESKATAKTVKHVDLDKVEAVIPGASGEIAYVQVIATITHGSIIEYVAYNSTNKVTIKPKPNNPEESGNTDGKNDDDKSAGLYVIIGVSAFLLIVVVVLIIVIVRYNSKNKDLLSQVNKISFVQSNAAENKDDANLLLDNQNELD